MITLYLYVLPSMRMERKEKGDKKSLEPCHKDTWLNRKDVQTGKEKTKKGQLLNL